MRKQPRVLKHIAHAAAMRRHKDVCGGIDQNIAVKGDAGMVGAQQSGNGIDQRGFARARAAKKRGNAVGGIKLRLQRQAGKGVGYGDGQHQARPPILRATTRPSHSQSTKATMAMVKDTMTKRSACASPSGTCSVA